MRNVSDQLTDGSTPRSRFQAPLSSITIEFTVAKTDADPRQSISIDHVMTTGDDAGRIPSVTQAGTT